VTDRFVVGVPLGRWQTNCWVVGDYDRGECVIIDPGETGAEVVPQILEHTGARCTGILVTHGHLDHFWSVPQLARELDVPVLLHPEDRYLWDSPISGFAEGSGPEMLKAQFGLVWEPEDERVRDVKDGERVTFAGIDFDIEHNPGHTPGHVTFLGRDLTGASLDFALGSADAASPDVLFSGDLIFAGSIGRTDFPRGSTADIMRSLARTVLPLQDDTLILSGHGTDTTVGRERLTNQFLHEAARGA
jgi:hydroxyacylglutathione hydrolase